MADRTPKFNSTLQAVPQPGLVEIIPITIVAPMAAINAGTPLATPNTLYQNVNPKNYKNLFGESSIVSKLYEAAYAVSPNHPIWVYPLEDLATGTSASTNMSITGTATSAGKLKLTIEGKVYEAQFLTGDTNIAIASNLFTAINADTGSTLTVTNAVDGEIAFTCKQKGVFGNYTSFKFEIFDVNGIKTSCGLSVTMNAFTGGAGLHNISELFTAAGIAKHQTHIFLNYNILKDNTAGILLIDEVENRKKVKNEVLNGRIFSTITDDDASFQILQLNTKYVNENIILHKFPTAPTGEAAGNNFDVLGIEATMAMLALFNPNADVINIKIISNRAKGTISNAGCNMGGTKIPSTKYAIDPANFGDDVFNFDDIEIDIWETLGVNVWNVKKGKYELQQDGLTCNHGGNGTGKNYKYFSTIVGIGYWQQMEYIELKKRISSGKATPITELIVVDTIKRLMLNFTEQEIFSKEHLSVMEQSIVSQFNPSDNQELDLTYSIRPILPLKGVTALINVNSALTEESFASEIQTSTN